MTEKTYFTGIAILFAFGAVVRGAVTILSNGSIDPQPAVEYRAVCSNLPANAHRNGSGRTDNGTRKEIPQFQSAPNVRGPSPIGEYDEVGTGSDTGCYFMCDRGYERKDGVCSALQEITYDPIAGTITVIDGRNTYTIQDKNLGATVAGTGKASYGRFFQRGNNFGFTSSGDLSPAPINTKQDGAGYGPSNWYSSNQFISTVDWSSVRNDNLRGGSGDDGAVGRDTQNARSQRQGPCSDGYHIPSQGEWNGLLRTWWSIRSGDVSEDEYYTSDNGDYVSGDYVGRRFRDDFLLPLAGYRLLWTSAVLVQGSSAYYWSSSPDGSSVARRLSLGSSKVDANSTNGRAHGSSVRCFQDS